MPIDSASFVFVITLAGVVNGLGIVRWLTGFTEYLRRRDSLNIPVYWVFILVACFQFLLHILFWWSLWGLRETGTINFLSYLYLLSGPIFLFVGSTLLMPVVDGDEFDLRAHYYATRPAYTTVLILLWLWAIFMSPVIRGMFAPTLPIFTVFLVNAVVMRASASENVHGVAAVVNWLLFAMFVGLYFLELGGWTNT